MKVCGLLPAIVIPAVAAAASTWATTAGTGAIIAAAHPITTGLAVATVGGTFGGVAANVINHAMDDNKNRRKSQGEQRNVRKANQGVTNNCHVRNEERHPNPRRYSSQSGNRVNSGKDTTR